MKNDVMSLRYLLTVAMVSRVWANDSQTDQSITPPSESRANDEFLAPSVGDLDPLR